MAGARRGRGRDRGPGRGVRRLGRELVEHGSHEHCGRDDRVDRRRRYHAPTDAGDVKKVAFFGFWKSNSFTQAVAKAVREETEKLGASSST